MSKRLCSREASAGGDKSVSEQLGDEGCGLNTSELLTGVDFFDSSNEDIENLCFDDDGKANFFSLGGSTPPHSESPFLVEHDQLQEHCGGSLATPLLEGETTAPRIKAADCSNSFLQCCPSLLMGDVRVRVRVRARLRGCG